MYPNNNSGLGRAMSDMLVATAQKFGVYTTGRFYFVGASTLSGYNEISAMYPASYPDGTRVLNTTLNAAVGQTSASRGDVIFVLPGHTENISSSTALTISDSGLAVIGLGVGNNRPHITIDTATTATINVTANSVVFANMIVIANFANIVSAFTLTTATDFQLLSCEIRDTDATHNFLAVVTTDTTSNDADGLVIDSCRIILKATSGAVNLVNPAGTNDRWKINGNNYSSLTTNAGAVIPIATGKVLTNLQLTNNLFNLVNATGTATAYLITTNGSTNSGFIHGNYDHALPTTPLLVTASSGFVYGANYHADAADTQGYLVPAADV